MGEMQAQGSEIGRTSKSTCLPGVFVAGRIDAAQYVF
jgi:hypothetical protein